VLDGSNIAAAVPVFVVSAVSSVVARVLGNSGPPVGFDSELALIVYYGWHTLPDELLCNNCLCSFIREAAGALPGLALILSDHEARVDARRALPWRAVSRAIGRSRRRR